MSASIGWISISLNEIYRYEAKSEAAMNKFNIYPDSIPYWLTEWLPEQEDILAGTWELDG